MQNNHPARLRRVCAKSRRRQMIHALRTLADQLGPDVTLRRFTQECGYSRAMIYDDFGRWADLRVQAGLPPHVDRGSNAVHTRESLIAALQQLAAQWQDDVSKIQFTHHTGISDSPIYRVFGNWRNFKIAAGLDPQPKPGIEPQYTRAELLDLLREQVRMSGRHIVMDQFCAATGLSRDVIGRCGGWMSLRRELGLPPRGHRHRQPSLKCMLSDLADVQTLLHDGDALRHELLMADEHFPPIDHSASELDRLTASAREPDDR